MNKIKNLHVEVDHTTRFYSMTDEGRIILAACQLDPLSHHEHPPNVPLVTDSSNIIFSDFPTRILDQRTQITFDFNFEFDQSNSCSHPPNSQAMKPLAQPKSTDSQPSLPDEVISIARGPVDTSEKFS